MNFIDKDKLFTFLENYCNEYNYDFERLKKQELSISNYTFFGFHRDFPDYIISQGLCYDIATQPYVTLMVTVDENSFKVYETEFTKQFLTKSSQEPDTLNMIDEAGLYRFLNVYCKKNNYDFNKLKKQKIRITNIALFGIHKDDSTEAILRDIEGKPYVTLIAVVEKNSFKVFDTEFTEKYLT